MSTGFFNEAHAEFVKNESAAPADQRTLRFGEAVSLLNVQPRTQANIDDAYTIFGELFAASPDDDIGWSSRYLQGRIDQIQRNKPDLAKADAIFSELIRKNPRHPVAERAHVKLAIIRIFAKAETVERRRHYDEFTRAAADFADRGIKAQMHLLLAEIARRFNYGYDEELQHMLAAHKAGITRRRMRADALVRIGDLARLTGRIDIAREYYTQFLAQYARNERRTTIEGYLAAFNSSAQ
jgi:tetratricopeptide (TPR) repeat protein